jgi:hypothetical protein
MAQQTLTGGHHSAACVIVKHQYNSHQAMAGGNGCVAASGVTNGGETA